MKVQGEATVSIAGTTQSATIGTPLYVGSVVKTGPAGSMGVTLKDNTVMSFGPNSELTLDEFLFDPAQDDLKLTAKITHGTLDYISGTIAKLKPEAVQINTPTGTIGVRGTHFLVKVD
ncbi:FecR family protein [Phytopseudomonas punonensis]|nr:FecR domain-containing protein [Pseudomonas punonensis]